jgi:CMP/dCMP kinase
MAAITISRQLGSEGEAVAQAVAQRLGYRVLSQELINQAAQRAGTPKLALAFFDVLGLLDLQPTAEEVQAYQQALQQLMAEWAAEGQVIIVGRAGCLWLKAHPDVLHVRIVAPLPQRIERVAQQRAVSWQAAQAQVEATDRARQTYVQHHHQVDWNDPTLYDLVLNLGRITVEHAAALICLAQASVRP